MNVCIIDLVDFYYSVFTQLFDMVVSIRRTMNEKLIETFSGFFPRAFFAVVLKLESLEIICHGK